MAFTKLKKRRSTALPRWSWSGGAIIRPLHERTEKVRSIVEHMPARSSDTDDLINELLQIGGRYQRYLHQDEFGPTRAERMAALRRSIEVIDAVSAMYVQLPQSMRRKISDALAINVTKISSHAMQQYLDDKAAPRRIALVVEKISAPADKGAARIKLIRQLVQAASRAGNVLSSLDTSTDNEIFLIGTTLAKRNGANETPDPSPNVRLARLRRRVMAALEHLEDKRGPEPAISLPRMVDELCELWRREVGLRVTGDSVGYRGNRVSEAGRFVLQLAELFQPDWQPPKSIEYPARTKVLSPQNRPALVRVVDRAILNYVASRPWETKRGRPPKQ